MRAEQLILMENNTAISAYIIKYDEHLNDILIRSNYCFINDGFKHNKFVFNGKYKTQTTSVLSSVL